MFLLCISLRPICHTLCHVTHTSSLLAFSADSHFASVLDFSSYIHLWLSTELLKAHHLLAFRLSTLAHIFCSHFGPYISVLISLIPFLVHLTSTGLILLFGVVFQFSIVFIHFYLLAVHYFYSIKLSQFWFTPPQSASLSHTSPFGSRAHFIAETLMQVLKEHSFSYLILL